MGHYKDHKDFKPTPTDFKPELLDKGLPSRPGPPYISELRCNEEGCTYRTRIQTSLHEETLKKHREKCCPLLPSEEKAPEGNGFQELIPPGAIIQVNQGQDLAEVTRAVKELQHYRSGMIREPLDGKTNWALVYDGPMLRRWAEHLTKGAETKGKRNWMKADSEEDLERFRESAARHFHQALAGETDEDHFAAVVFNLNGMLHVMEKLERD